jgi:hypothetical protein
MGVFLLVVGLPLLLALVFGLFAFKGARPMLYRCVRCGRQFRRPAHRGFPETCPGCGAADWNA